METQLIKYQRMVDELKSELQRLRDLLIEIYETDGVGMTGYMIDKVEKELGDDYFNRHVT